MSIRDTLMAVVLAPLAAAPLAGQPLADRIAGVRDGTVRLSFATRPHVCGAGELIGFDLPDAFYAYTTWRAGYSVNVNRDVRPDCRTGPLRLVVVRSGGRVTELRAAVGVTWRASATAVDLGTVSAPGAGSWLLDLAMRAENGNVAGTALLAAVAADSVRLTDRVLEIVRNRRLADDTRTRVMRWADVIGAVEGRTEDMDRALRAVAADADEPASVRERAIRELSASDQNRAHLRSLYGEIRETDLRDRILREIASRGSDEEREWLRRVALDGAEPVALRERALRVVAAQGGSGTLDWIRQVAETRDEETGLRERAIRLLAEHGDFDYLQALYPRLERLALKERVIRTNADRGDADASEWLADIVLNDREETRLRDRAVRSLADAGAPSGELAALYDRVTSSTVKRRLIRVLADRRDDAAAEKLAAIATDDPDAALRREAARHRD